MSCPSCGSFYGCNCGADCITETIEDCEHEDPGLETSGAHLAIYDYLFNQRRLQNAEGVLTCKTVVGGSGFQIQFSTSPDILYAALPLPLNTPFDGLVVSTGSAGANRRLVPTAEGFIRANANGTFQTVLLPTATIPDPLTVTTFSASTINVADLTVTGLPIFSALQNGTITKNIGLNAGNELVIGSVAQASVAKFHENVVETDGARPNASLVAGSYVKYTNEIYDPDGLAHPINSEKIEIDQDGTYIVRWGVGFGRHQDQGSDGQWMPRLALEYNGGLVSYGDNPDGTFRKSSALTATGQWIGALNAGDSFRLKISNAFSGEGMPNNPGGTASGVSGANMILTRLK